MYIIYTLSDSDRLYFINLLHADENLKALIWAKDVPVNAINPVEVSELIDLEFRDAWRHGGNKIIHDLTEAKNMQLERIRVKRKPLFEPLDAAYMKALEMMDANAKETITEQKNILRDMTLSLKNLNPQSIDDIKNAWPKELERYYVE